MIGLRTIRRSIPIFVMSVLSVGALSCSGTSQVDRDRLDQLAADPILVHPPAGFIPEGTAQESVGADNLQGDRSGSEVTQNYSTTSSVAAGRDAWVTQLEDQGWTIQQVRCFPTHVNVIAFKSFNGFMGLARATARQEDGQLRLEAPVDGEDTFATSPPLQETCEQ